MGRGDTPFPAQTVLVKAFGEALEREDVSVPPGNRELSLGPSINMIDCPIPVTDRPAVDAVRQGYKRVLNQIETIVINSLCFDFARAHIQDGAEPHESRKAVGHGAIAMCISE
jgi:hypothetical protein